MRLRNSLVTAGAVAVLVIAGATTVAAVGGSQPVECTVTDNVLSCPLPVAPPVTTTETATATVTTTAAPVTATATVTQPPATSTVTVTATPTTPPSTTTTAPTTSTPATTTTTTTPPPPAGTFPDSTTTGVPAGVTLAPYTGGCTIWTNNVTIDGKDVKAKCGEIVAYAMGLTIKNSRVPRVESTYKDGGSSVTISDSDVIAGAWSEGALWGYNITATRVDITGGQHSFHCNDNCTVTDSYMHNQYNPAGGSYHNNAFITNGGSNMVVRGNTLHCTPLLNNTNGGCTGDVALFGDFDPVTNVVIDHNLLKANNSSISFCAYGGNEPSKPYQASGVRFTNNVFERGSNNKCGVYGPVSSFNSAAAGNIWTGNKWNTGEVVNP